MFKNGDIPFVVCVVGGVVCDVLDGCGVVVANDGGVPSVVSIVSDDVLVVAILVGVVVVGVVVADGDGGDCVVGEDGDEVVESLNESNVVTVRDVFVDADSGCVALRADVTDVVFCCGCNSSADSGGLGCLIVCP